VLRTFSKWAGLGGLRIGYGVYPLALARHLWKIKPPYSINVAAQEAVLASLAERDYLMANVARIVAERERLLWTLAQMPGVRPYPSQSNFILCRIAGESSLEVKRRLERNGILVRYYSKTGLSDCIRVSVGRPEQNDALVRGLQSALNALTATKSP